MRITCIMPTSGARRRFIGRAIGDFLAQDYLDKHLIILDEPQGAEPLSIDSPLVTVVTLDGPIAATIGAKRNLAVALADGEIVCHWDDDDYHGPDRLTRQAAPILRDEADITGLPLEDVYSVRDGRTWRASPALAREIFALGVHGGTIMYRRSLWSETAVFANVNSGEDGDFVRLLLARGARLSAVENRGAYVYVRHESRWPLDEHHYQHADEWREIVA